MASTFDLSLSHTIDHGAAHSMSVSDIDTTVAPNGSASRQVILEVVIKWDGYELPSHMTIRLLRPRPTFVADDGRTHALDKWNPYPISTYGLPEPESLGVSRTEMRRNTAFNDFSLRRSYIDRFWEPTPGGSYIDNVSNVLDTVANPGWQGNRAVHDFHYGFDFDGLEFVTRTLRLMTTIEGIAERYLMEFSMYRGQRNLIHVVRFDIAGAVGANDFLEAAYIPLAIVYCPPGQDMTNSLKEIESHGTRFTFGESRLTAAGESSAIGASLRGQYGFVGINASVEDTTTESQAISDGSSSTIRISKTQETTVTANNQRAIGRAHWGPLGDIFVILKDMLFLVSEVFDEDSGYSVVPISASPRSRKLLISTYELLRPPPGSEAAAIPWEQRKRILLLDPFVVRDENVLDQVAAGALTPETAVDSSLDPNTADNPTRAVPVLQLTPSAGTELTFYQSTGITIERMETHAVRYTTEFRSATSVGLSIGIPVVGVGLNSNFAEEQTIEYQTTSEMSQEQSLVKAAQCYLLRNQNDLHVGPIDVYYDTVFGTFLFRTIQNQSCTQVSGIVTTKRKLPLSFAQIRLLDVKGVQIAAAVSGARGQFALPCRPLKPGHYVVVVGGVEHPFEVGKKASRAVWVSVVDAKRELNIARARRSDLAELFDIGRNDVARVRARLLRARSVDEVYAAVGGDADPEQLKKWLVVHAEQDNEDQRRYPSRLLKALASAREERPKPLAKDDPGKQKR